MKSMLPRNWVLNTDLLCDWLLAFRHAATESTEQMVTEVSAGRRYVIPGAVWWSKFCLKGRAVGRMERCEENEDKNEKVTDFTPANFLNQI